LFVGTFLYRLLNSDSGYSPTVLCPVVFAWVGRSIL